MRYCFCSIAFRGTPIEEIVTRLAKIGYDAVEIWWKHIESRSDSELRDLRKLAADQGIGIEVISPYFWLTQNRDLYDRSIETAGLAIKAARALGCPKIRTFTDAGPTGIGSDVATEEHWDHAVRALQEITHTASDLLFPVETHANTLADTPDSVLGLIERVGAPNLKVLYQAMDENSMIAEFDQLREHIAHIHIQNHDAEGTHGPIEEGVVDIAGLLEHARSTGYRGSLSVEYCHKGATWDQAESAIQWLRSLEGAGSPR